MLVTCCKSSAIRTDVDTVWNGSEPPCYAERMVGNETFLVELSRDVRELVDTSRTDLVEELRSIGLDVTYGSGHDPTLPRGSKEIALVIIAVATAAPMVATAIARVVDALGRNKSDVKTKRLVRSTAADGSVVETWDEHQSTKPRATKASESTKVSASPWKLEVSLNSENA